MQKLHQILVHFLGLFLQRKIGEKMRFFANMLAADQSNAKLNPQNWLLCRRSLVLVGTSAPQKKMFWPPRRHTPGPSGRPPFSLLETPPLGLSMKTDPPSLPDASDSSSPPPSRKKTETATKLFSYARNSIYYRSRARSEFFDRTFPIAANREIRTLRSEAFVFSCTFHRASNVLVCSVYQF